MSPNPFVSGVSGLTVSLATDAGVEIAPDGRWRRSGSMGGAPWGGLPGLMRDVARATKLAYRSGPAFTPRQVGDSSGFGSGTPSPIHLDWVPSRWVGETHSTVPVVGPAEAGPLPSR